MNAFAAALEVLHSDINLAADATYIPHGGNPFDVRVILSQPDAEMEFRSTRLSVPTCVASFLVAEVPAPAEGDTFEADGVTYRIQGRPERDVQRLTWRCEAVAI